MLKHYNIEKIINYIVFQLTYSQTFLPNNRYPLSAVSEQLKARTKSIYDSLHSSFCDNFDYETTTAKTYYSFLFYVLFASNQQHSFVVFFIRKITDRTDNIDGQNIR